MSFCGHTDFPELDNLIDTVLVNQVQEDELDQPAIAANYHQVANYFRRMELEAEVRSLEEALKFSCEPIPILEELREIQEKLSMICDQFHS